MNVFNYGYLFRRPAFASVAAVTGVLLAAAAYAAPAVILPDAADSRDACTCPSMP